MNGQQQTTLVVIASLIVCALVFYFVVKPKLESRQQQSLSSAPTTTTPLLIPASVSPAVTPPPPVTIINAPIGKTLSIERKTGTDYINIGTLAAFYQGTKYDTVSGGATPLWNATQPWNNMVDTDAATWTATQNTADARIWIDFGRDVPVDRIVVENRVDGFQDRIMGCTVVLRNAAGSIVWSQDISHPQLAYTFITTATVPPLVMGGQPKGRTLAVERKTGNQHINIGTIAALYQGTPYKAVSGGVAPIGAGTWSQLVDTSATTGVETNNADGTARMWIDIGLDVPVDAVLIENRVDCCQDRLLGCAVVLRNNAGQTVWTQDIVDIKASYRWAISTTGQTTLTTVAMPPLLNTVISLLPSQDVPPIVSDWSGTDGTNPIGWTFINGARRVRNTNNAWGNLPNPSASPYYNLMQGAGSVLRTTVPNLVVGRSYQLSGYVSNRPGFPASALEVALDSKIIIPKMGPLDSKFVPLGPVTVQATATSHILEFRNVSAPGDCTVLLDGLSFKLV